MQETIYIYSKTFERLKEQARKLKKEKKITHTQALDEVAQSLGFNHWHHVTQCRELTKPIEEQLKSRCVLAFDRKDGLEITTDNDFMAAEELLSHECNEVLFDIFINSPDEEDSSGRLYKDLYELSYLRESFFAYECMFFKLSEKYSNASLKEVLELTRKYSFFPPEYVWLGGKLIDTYDAPATDDEGNVVGVRL